MDDLQESFKAKYTVSAPFSPGLIKVKGIILINELVFDTNKLLILLGHYVCFQKNIYNTYNKNNENNKKKIKQEKKKNNDNKKYIDDNYQN